MPTRGCSEVPESRENGSPPTTAGRRTAADALNALTVQEGECIVWRTGDGYPWLRYRGSYYQASHLAWVLHNGVDVPAGSCVLHLCDNPRCVRGEHLVAGDQKLNARHTMCRARWGSQVKLDWQKVAYIRARDNAVSVREIARELGVCKNTVRDVRKRRSWTADCSDSPDMRIY
jgi:hypothetical protein